MILSARRLAASVTHTAFQAFDSLSSSAGRLPSISYQPVAQDVFSSKETSKSWFKRDRKYFWYAIAALFVIVGGATYWRHSDPVDIAVAARKQISRDRYIEAVLQNPVVGVFDPVPIRALCDATKFQEGLVWQCGVLIGGIGNVANMLLNCVRYAIEAGATTLILPRLGARSNNLIDLGGETQNVDLSTSFNVEYFLEQWKIACPQMHAVPSDSMAAKSSIKPLDLEPQHVKKFNTTGKYMITDPTGWRQAFDGWLDIHAGLKNVTAETPVWVHQHWELAQWNPDVHTPEFVRSFPRLFQHPAQTHYMAASALWALEQNVSRPIVADSVLFPANGSLSVNAIGPGRIVSNGFLGAHLRVAADAAFAGFPGYDAQAPFYLSEAKRLNMTTIYLASGSAEHREKFRKDAALLGMTVFVKEDLLDAGQVEELKSLTWDQQALVDYDILIHSSWFVGAVRSSFSWLLVADRTTLPEARLHDMGSDDKNATAGDKEKKPEKFQDGLSAIAGKWESDRPPVGTWPM